MAVGKFVFATGIRVEHNRVFNDITWPFLRITPRQFGASSDLWIYDHSTIIISEPQEVIGQDLPSEKFR